MTQLERNFIEYPWKSWEEAWKHYKDTYPALDLKDFLHRLADTTEEELDESTFADIATAFYEYE